MTAKQAVTESLKIETLALDDPTNIERVAYRISSAGPECAPGPALIVNIFDNADNPYFQQVQLRWSIGFESDSRCELTGLRGRQLGSALVAAAYIIEELEETGRWSGELPPDLVG